MKVHELIAELSAYDDQDEVTVAFAWSDCSVFDDVVHTSKNGYRTIQLNTAGNPVFGEAGDLNGD